MPEFCVSRPSHLPPDKVLQRPRLCSRQIQDISHAEASPLLLAAERQSARQWGIPSMSNTSHAVIMSDTDGIISHWNSGAQQLFGYSPTEAIGQSLDLIVPEEFRERHWAGFRKAISTGVCNLDRATTNIPVRHKNGSVEPYPGRFVFLQGPRGDVLGVIGLYSPREGAEAAFGPIRSV
jgi:PAS domain S-box-containing protein